MTLVPIGGFMRWPGYTAVIVSAPGVSTNTTLDAAGEYTSFVFQAKEDMTISHVGWRNGTVAGSPTVDTRIETVGADGLPTGTLWAANTNLVSGTLVSNTWNLFALTASATILKGEFFAVKIAYASGTSVIVQQIAGPRSAAVNAPYSVTNVSGAPVKSNQLTAYNVAFGSSATTFYSMENSYAATTVTAGTFNNTSSAKRGLRFQVPFACQCAGICWYNGSAAGDFNAALLDDAGAELASSNTVFEGDRSGLNANVSMTVVFDSPVTLTPGTWYRASLEPTSATNINIHFATLPSADYRSAWPGGLNTNYATFTSGGGWIDTATNQLPMMDILIDQIDDGAGGGGGSGGAHIMGGTVVR